MVYSVRFHLCILAKHCESEPGPWNQSGLMEFSHQIILFLNVKNAFYLKKNGLKKNLTKILSKSQKCGLLCLIDLTKQKHNIELRSMSHFWSQQIYYWHIILAIIMYHSHYLNLSFLHNLYILTQSIELNICHWHMRGDHCHTVRHQIHCWVL